MTEPTTIDVRCARCGSTTTVPYGPRAIGAVHDHQPSCPNPPHADEELVP